MSEEELNAYCEQAWSESDKHEGFHSSKDVWFVGSWDNAMKLADVLELLTYPRYIQHSKNGPWHVKDKLYKVPLATGDTGPLAICRAVVILHYGKGRSHSTVQKD